VRGCSTCLPPRFDNPGYRLGIDIAVDGDSGGSSVVVGEVSRDAGLVPELDNNVTGYVCVGWQEWVMCGECKMIIPPIAPWPPLNRQC